MKLQNKKGFTLIELVVVMAIIGVLAVALVPRLTGVQERSRDTARVTSLQNISAVLQAYHSDHGTYPLSPDNTTDIDDSAGTSCFSSTEGNINKKLGELFKGELAPVDPQRSNTAGACGTAASFGYSALSKGGINQNGYILYAHVEGYLTANLQATALDATNLNPNGSSTYEDIKGTTIGTWAKYEEAPANLKELIYAVTP